MTATRIYTYDSTLRDGEQCEGITLSLADKLAIVRRLDEFGIDYIEGGFPASNPKDVAFFREVAAMDLKHAQIAAFGSTSPLPRIPGWPTSSRAGRRWSLSSGRRGTPRWSARCKRRSKRTCA